MPSSSSSLEYIFEYFLYSIYLFLFCILFCVYFLFLFLLHFDDLEKAKWEKKWCFSGKTTRQFFLNLGSEKTKSVVFSSEIIKNVFSLFQRKKGKREILKEKREEKK